MSVNSSNSSLDAVFFYCANSMTYVATAALVVTKALLILPPAVFILYLGHLKWRKQRSFKNTSHSDILTYHLALMELIGVSSTAFFLIGFQFPDMLTVAFCLLSIPFCGEILFHILTCVERYLAVVHPVTYLGLKNVDGARIRNTCIGSVWLLCFGWSGLVFLYVPNYPVIPFVCLLTFTFIVVSFCSLSVLCVLIRPGPGEVGGARGHVDQSKQRAFHTVLAITGVLLLYFIGYLVCIVLDVSDLLSYSDRCLVLSFGPWLDLPVCLVLPLLFLQRAGKLTCCCSRAN